MIRIIPVSSLLLALIAIHLKLIYGSLHSAITKIYGIKDISLEVRQQFNTVNSRIALLTIIIAILSVGISTVCLNKKLCSRWIGIILLVISCISFLVSLLSI